MKIGRIRQIGPSGLIVCVVVGVLAAATGDCAIRRCEIMVKAFAKKSLFVTVIASLIGLPLFAQAQDKPLK